jgi:hypothetical protein
MPDALDRPDEGEAAIEEGSSASAPPPAPAPDPPEVKLPDGASAGDDGCTLEGEKTDEDVGELTEAQRYEDDPPLGDGPDELWDDLARVRPVQADSEAE